MTRLEIWKDFFKKTVLPVGITICLVLMFKGLFQADGRTDYVSLWVCCGIPFGIPRMFIWIVPYGHDPAGTMGIILMDLVVGGIIGGVVLLWRLVVGAWYIPLTIYRLLTVGRYAAPID